MQKLIRGLHRFQERVFRPRRELYQRLALGQRPETLFITCSDSRVLPNQLTQTGPGELFILRGAANIVPPYGTVAGGEEATIEYAIDALGVTDVILCGHSDCGGMRALLDPSLAQELPAMTRWLGHASRTRDIVEQNYSHLSGQARVMAAIEENVLVQLENLRTHPSVARAEEVGRLRLHGWVYKIETGDVFSYDPTSGQFLSLQPEVRSGTSG